MAFVDTNKKRRFQQLNLTTFLLPNQNTVDATIPAISPSGLLSPSLPYEVQVSLLQVGMRIRKSVNDGYKTAKKSPMCTNVILTSNCAAKNCTQSPRSISSLSTSDTVSPPSQNSSSSNTPATMAPPTSRKRGLSSSSDCSIYVDSSHTPASTAMDMSPPLRPIAQAKTRRRNFLALNGCGVPENGAMKIDDFEEVDFLKPLDDGERSVWHE